MLRLQTWLLMASTLLAYVSLTSCHNSRSTVLYEYVVIGPGNAHIVRAIIGTSELTCPDVILADANGGELVRRMDVRAVPTTEHPVLVCEHELPTTVSEARLWTKESGLGRPLPLLKDPQLVYLVGDTGCRLDETHAPQACRNSSAWPMAKIMERIAQGPPGLVVHIGDYMYRETPCPDDAAELCGQTPFGNTFAAWDVDFFQPARRVLRRYPWVVIRGNHEACEREAGHVGYFRYLYPGRYAPDDPCPLYTAPLTVDLPRARFLVMDTSVTTTEHPSDPKIDGFEAMVDEFSRQFDGVLDAASSPAARSSYLLTHRPVYGVRLDVDGKTAVVEDYTLQQAMDSSLARRGGSFPANLRALVAGHTHLMQAVLYDAGDEAPTAKTRQRPHVLEAANPLPWFPPQLYIGNSGTSLSSALSASQLREARCPLRNVAPADGFSLARHGYAILSFSADSAAATIAYHNVDGAVVAEISL